MSITRPIVKVSQVINGISQFSNDSPFQPSCVHGPGSFSHQLVAYALTMPTKSVRFADERPPKWRWCCRYGWYPVLVASSITAACLLDILSSMSCEFLKVHVDNDTGESRGSVYIGIYFHQMGGFEDGQFGEYLAEGCQQYSDEFEANIIEGDRMWQATRYVGILSATTGIIAAVTCWLLVLAPIPSGCIWSGIVLPLVFIAFLAEGLKFLFLDVKVCSAALWYKNRTDCEFATTGYIAVASSMIFFLCAVMVCLHKPKLMVSTNYSRRSKCSDEEASTANLIDDLELQQTESYDTESIINEALQTIDEEPEVQGHTESVTINEEPKEEPRKVFVSEDPDAERRQSTSSVDPEGHMVPPLPHAQVTSTPPSQLTATKNRTPMDPLPISRVPVDP